MIKDKYDRYQKGKVTRKERGTEWYKTKKPLKLRLMLLQFAVRDRGQKNLLV